MVMENTAYMLLIMEALLDFRLRTGQILDLAEQLKINKITGGRAVVAEIFYQEKLIYLLQMREVKIFCITTLMDISRT